MSGITSISSVAATQVERAHASQATQTQQPESVQEAIQERTAELGPPELTVEEIREVVDSLNNVMSLLQRGVSFQVDDSTQRTIVKIIDNETDETIKQFPTEDLVRLIERMQEMQSIIFDSETKV